MDPTQIGIRLASSALAPLVKKLFRTEGPGAGLVDRPVRLSSYVSFKEQRTLTESDLRRLAAELVDRALAAPGERPLPDGEEAGVVEALTRTLHALGDLTLTDVEAVALGPEALAARLRAAAPDPGLSREAGYFHDRLLDTTCLHVLHFFTQRSTFVAAALVHQTRRQAELIAKIDELIVRIPRQDARDTAFEQRYLAYVARRHSALTIYGIDLPPGSAKWPLDAAYMSLEATGRPPQPAGPGAPARGLAGGLPAAAGRPAEAPARPAPLPADQALAAHQRVLLRGEAGSGKTTLVQWLAVSAARPEPDGRMSYIRDRIPYVLPLRTLARHGALPAPGGFLDAVGSPLAGARPDGWETRVLDAGRALVLVDGLDEIPEPERDATREWLSGLIAAYPGNRWLVTTRPSAVREDWLTDEDFAELALAPMTGRDVAAFIGRWHAAAVTGRPDEDAALPDLEARLRQSVRRTSDLARLATNPLMCGLICALHRDRHGFLPLGRHSLYAAALSMLLTRRDRERRVHMTAELAEEPQLQLLQRLAYWLIRNGRTEMDRDRAEALIAEALPSVHQAQVVFGDARAAFTYFLARSGLLREPVPGTVEFVHRTFQDYLGARAAVDEGGFGELAAHVGDDQWEDVIRMAVAHARPRERAELIRALLADPGDRATLLAFACLEYAAELDVGVREEVEGRARRLIPPSGPEQARRLAEAGPIVLELLPGPDWLGETAAHHVVLAASHVMSDRTVGFLSRFSSHPSPRVQEELMAAWSRFDPLSYAQEVIARLDPARVRFTVRSDEQLMALGLTSGSVERLKADGEVSTAALRAYADRHGFQDLTVHHNPGLRDLSFLRHQSRLLRLEIAGCQALEDLDGLGGLPLESVVLGVPRHPGGLELLATLPRLRRLGLFLKDAEWRVADLSPEAPLQVLSLSGTALTDGLGGLSRHRQLGGLYLDREGSPRDAADWAELDALPQLTHLNVTAASLLPAPADLCLPQVRELYLNDHARAPAAVDRVPVLFPGVIDLYVDHADADVHVPQLPGHIAVHAM